ncbi:MAG: phage tail protein [Hydrogenovibrio crunogenus]|nr:phage tail protein [Hydrogenovibrio crunogenus]
MSANLYLRISGQNQPFFNASVTFSLGQLAHSFRATIPFMAINQPLKVEWFLDDTRLFKGQIDSVDEAIDGKTISIAGRSQSANFIDSRIKTDALYSQSFESILATLLKDYGLGVQNNVKQAVADIPEFQINAQSPFSEIAQLAKHRNLHLIERNGAIQIERPGQFAVQNLVLEEGKNLENLTIKRNWSQVYHTYEIQNGWDTGEATATYAPADKSRKCVIIADKLQDQQACQDRAEYEKNLAIAKTLTVSAKVPGLYKELSNSAINKMVQVKVPSRTYSEKLLIKSITMNQSESEKATDIELFRPFMEIE